MRLTRSKAMLIKHGVNEEEIVMIPPSDDDEDGD